MPLLPHQPSLCFKICPGYSSSRLRSWCHPELAFSVEKVSSLFPLFQPHPPSCLHFNRLMLSHVPVAQDHFVPVHDKSPQLHLASPFTSWFCIQPSEQLCTSRAHTSAHHILPFLQLPQRNHHGHWLGCHELFST